VVVAVGVLFVIGASTVWAVSGGLPDHGQGQAMFVQPVTSTTPSGERSVNLPVVDDVAPRPGIQFTAGVSYSEALTAYYEARYRGEDLPEGAALVEGLRPGIVVAIGADGRVTLDPAAPFGYDPATRVVQDPTYTMPGYLTNEELGARIKEARQRGWAIPRGGSVTKTPLPRCEVQLAESPASESCPRRAAQPAELVQLK
jgi:hypothetical protein